FFVLYFTSLSNYLFFHSLVEIFSIVIGVGIFVVLWTARRMIKNNYLRFIGIAYLFISSIDLVHTLGYKGMGVFQGSGGNLSTSLWIGARSIQAISLLIAPLMIRRKMNITSLFVGFSVVISLLMGSIFIWDVFPTCYIDGVGLTPFKVYSEYVISLILLGSLGLLIRYRNRFSSSVFRLLAASIILTIGSELAFTFYVSVFGLFNTFGHYFKMIAFYLVYKAIIHTGIVNPYDLIFRDLSNRTEELYHANVRLKELGSIKNSFISSMSHELRTPLNSIIGFTGIMLQGMAGELTEEQRKQLTIVKKSGDHLLVLISDLIDVSRIEANQIKLDIKEFNFSDMMWELLDSFKVATDKKGLKLVLKMPETLMVESDERRMKQIIMNFVSNAVKFTDEGAIEIHVVEADEKVEVSVKDTGMGLKDEDMDMLFKQFSRIRVEGRTTVEGTGLGLYISKKMSDLLSGKIKVESEYGVGSKFTVIIPLRYEKAI
ncbi:MAG: MASE3 domain-containing protein, partial [Candidatus Bathyarchaeia archaeon]